MYVTCREPKLKVEGDISSHLLMSSPDMHVYLLRTKDEVLKAFKEYKAGVENETGKNIKELRSDKGGEYMLRDFDRYYKELGSVHSVTPYSPQFNGVTESKNKTLVNMVNTMLISLGLPQNLWEGSTDERISHSEQSIVRQGQSHYL